MKSMKNIIFSLFCIVTFLTSSLTMDYLRKSPICQNAKSINDTKPYYEDLYFLKNTLPKEHPDLFFKLSKSDYYNKINYLLENQTTYSVDKMRFEIMKLIASIGDGHTETYVKSNKYFPITFSWFYNNSLRITCCSKQYKKLLGCKVIKINNIPLFSIVDKLNSICSNESTAWMNYKFINGMQSYELLKVLNIIPNGYLNLELEDLASNKFNVKIYPLTEEEFESSYFIDLQRNKRDTPLKPQMASDNYWYKFDNTNKIFYFKYKSCIDRKTALIIGDDISSYKPDLNSFFDTLVKSFDKSSSQKFILDVRGNLGGNPKIIKLLIEKLTKDSKFSEFQKCQNRIFVLTDNSTFSAGVFAALNFKQNFHNVKVVGKPTGGAQNVFANPKTKLLNCSNLFLTYATRKYSDGSNERSSLIPDIDPPLLIKDAFLKIDPDYETVKLLKIH